MQPWKDIHYARVQEFVRLLAETLPEAITRPKPSPTAPTPEPPKSPPPPTSPAAAKPAARPPGPTASSVFGKIPWKK